jgi:hypothetical protein
MTESPAIDTRVVDEIYQQISGRAHSLLMSLDVERQEHDSFLFISAELAPDIDVDDTFRVGNLIRETMAKYNPNAIASDAWVAALRYEGKIAHMVTADNMSLD